MTIHLHWWAIPLLVVFVGIVIAWRHEDQGSYMPDFTGPFVIFVAIVIALALCVGHWL